MRFELSGNIDNRPVPVTVYFNEDTDWDPSLYVDVGYSYFDVICIGAGGGSGGGVDTGGTTNSIRVFGGSGGGGGFHRAQGLLSLLPSPCSVLVGTKGIEGTTHVSDPSLTTNGGDGGPSIFNDLSNTCCASGGKGGKRAQSIADDASTDADGGEGGIGGDITAGGGASGGNSGTPVPGGTPVSGTSGDNGSFDGSIGSGGGGGAGGIGKYSGGAGTTLLQATRGGAGSYDLSSLSISAPGTGQGDTDHAGKKISPGGAGGAKIPVFDIESVDTTVYGSSVEPVKPGVVVVRLS